MAGATLISDGARLDGAIVEAAYAFDRPPLLKRLGDDGVLRIVDLQTLRFAGPRYLETAALSRLPYAPSTRSPSTTSRAAPRNRWHATGCSTHKIAAAMHTSHQPCHCSTSNLINGSSMRIDSSAQRSRTTEPARSSASH
jgi:hypothetical protein